MCAPQKPEGDAHEAGSKVTERHEATKCIRIGEARYLRAAKGSQGQYWYKLSFEKKENKTSQHCNGSKGQSSPWERQSLGGGHGEAQKLRRTKSS